MLSTYIGTSFQFSVGCNGSVVPLVTSVDRLLRYFLGQFIRRGTMTFTAASGVSFTCGDGTGQPVSVRFLNARTERRILQSRTDAGRSLYGRHARGREWLDRG